LWTGNVSRNKSALVAWRTVCLPKAEGGLGFFDIKAHNNSYLAKQIWNIHLKADSIWIQWVHHYYVPTPFGTLQHPQVPHLYGNPSSAFEINLWRWEVVNPILSF
jgi:hypothetical protein